MCVGFGSVSGHPKISIFQRYHTFCVMGGSNISNEVGMERTR